MDPKEPPAEFKCPLSGVIMRDPVLLSTGVTYERENIVHFLADRNNTVCPISGENIERREIWPNLTLKHLILAWRTENEVPPPEPIVDQLKFTETSEALSLLEEIKTTTAAVYRSLSAFKYLLSSKRAIASSIFRQHNLTHQLLLRSDFCNDLVDLFYLITNKEDDATLQVLTEAPAVTSLLLRGLHFRWVQTKTYAVSCFYRMCKIPSYKDIVGASGALESILVFAEEQDYELFKAACFAMERACTDNPENKKLVVKFGGIPRLLHRLISDTTLVVPILYLCSKLPLARMRMSDLAVVPNLLSVLRRDQEDIGVMRQCICMTDALYHMDEAHIILEEVEHGTISKLARHGDAVVNEIAQNLLNSINRSPKRRRAV